MKRMVLAGLVGCLSAALLSGCKPGRIVPLRVCLADGAWGGLQTAAAEARAADTIVAASKIWWAADIAFLPLPDAVRISDPQPPGTSLDVPPYRALGKVGDVRIRDGFGYGSDEADALVTLCGRALQERFPGSSQPGFTVIFVRELISETGQFLAVSGVSTELRPLFSAAGPRLCQRPPSVTKADVLGRASIIETVDAGKVRTVEEASVVLAHELGHDLLLGHGDGLDNDMEGPWDEFCDVETEPPLALGLSGSQKPLMLDRVADGILISPLQIERAQASAAALMKVP